MRASIVIPTFWRGPAKNGNACEFESDYVYDHATPLDSEGTLGRTLESLSVLEDAGEFSVAVLAVPTRTELKQAVQLRVQTIVAQFEYKYPIVVIGPAEMMLWRQRLARKGLFQYDHLLSLDGYANVRNMCLLAAVFSSADVAVLFDDGEVYEDPGYLRKALEFIGKEHEGSFVGGIAGNMLREGDPFLIPPAEEAWQMKWGRVSSINRVFEAIEEQPRLSKTSYAKGGNMVIHRDVFENIPFDPTIPRGESIDYLMNARLSGYDFFLDKELWIKQVDSPQCAPSWFKLRLDIIRFARERAKLNAARERKIGVGVDVDAADFSPYPGRFLGDDLHDIVFETSMEMASSYFHEGMEEDANESIMNIAISKAEAREGDEALDSYMALQQQWREFIAIAPSSGIWQPETVSD